MKCATCGSLLSSENAPCPKCLLSGRADVDSFAGFQLEDELGRGGMGTVFRARHLRLNRTVAVKFLAPEIAKDSQMVARFEREARALAMLEHPNIVRIYDFGSEDSESYLVMECVTGGTTAEKMPWPVDDAVRITSEVCAALSYAHARGIVHRDIKPANILLDAEGHVKVTDFGIARALKPDSGWTVTSPDVALGSVGFVAPEVMTGAAPDPRMDVFSVGALLRTLLTGRPPIGETESLPVRLVPIIRRAMSENPNDRFASVDQLKEALAQLGKTTALPADEVLWLRAAAFADTAAIASVLWAALLSLTPRVLEKNDLMPLLSYGAEQVDAHQVLTRARFETGAILFALVAVSIGFAATAFLRRHWRLEGLEQNASQQPLPHTSKVLAFGVFTVISYALRVWAVSKGYVLGGNEAPSWLSYLPFFGGVLEVVVLFFTVEAVLEATRRHRPLLKEPLLLIGQGMALVPPVLEFFRTL